MIKKLPDMITLLRLLLTCLLNVYILCCFGKIAIPIVISFVIFLSDFLDGRIARHMGNTSCFGAVFDVAADLIYIVTFYGTLVYLNIAPFWFLAVILFKFIEFVTTSHLLKKHLTESTMFISDFLGRFAAVLFYITPLSIYVSFQLSPSVYGFTRYILFCTAMVAVFVSSIQRVWNCAKYIFQGHFSTNQQMTKINV